MPSWHGSKRQEHDCKNVPTYFFFVIDHLSLALLLSQLYWQPVSLILSCPDLFFTTLKCNVPLF